MAAPTNMELSRRLRIMARSANQENVRRTLLLAAERLYKSGNGHKQIKRNGKRAQMLYTVWDNRTDTLIALDETLKKCTELMHMTDDAFYKAARGKVKKWRVEKKFADESLRELGTTSV